MSFVSETIFALATPRGKGAIAIIRISGPHAPEAARALAGRVPSPRRASLAQLRDPKTGETLDEALLFYFPGPSSFTGEDQIEIQAHGGPAVISGLLDALAALPGLRPAEPGEFTRRAYLNGRLDLTAAEGLSDLIIAETSAQRRQALRQLGGDLADLVERWRIDLKTLMAKLEAEIDFPDEDLGLSRTEENRGPLSLLCKEIAAHLANAGRGERLRDGYRVALVGAPNMGKSSLLNALAKREVAIVSDEPGTTRDILELHLDLGGFPVIVADMAGLRTKAAHVESLGIAKAKRRAEEADLRLFLIDQSAPASLPEVVGTLRTPDDLILRTKADLRSGNGAESGEIEVSAVTGAGLTQLLAEIETRALRSLGTEGAPVFTRIRHREALKGALALLDRTASQWTSAPPELIAEDLRLAARTLGRITSAIDVEEILEVVFAEFCIGK